jgi:hypothetical protein
VLFIWSCHAIFIFILGFGPFELTSGVHANLILFLFSSVGNTRSEPTWLAGLPAFLRTSASYHHRILSPLADI